MLDPLDPSCLTDHNHSELATGEIQQEAVQQPTTPTTPIRRSRTGNRRSIGLTLSPKSSVVPVDCNLPANPSHSKLSVSASSFKRRSLNLANLLRHPTSMRNQSSSTTGHRSPTNPEHYRQPFPPVTPIHPTPPPLPSRPTNLKSSSSARKSLPPNLQLRPGPPPESPVTCPCCSRSITLDHSRLSQPARCPTCAIIWDSPDSFLVSPKIDQSTRSDEDRLYTSQTSTASEHPASSILTITEEQVAQLHSLSLSHEQLESFERDPSAFLASVSPNSALDRLIKEFDRLALELLTKLFSSIANLSTAFLAKPTTDKQPKPRHQAHQAVQIELVNSFFQAICGRPTGRDILLSQLYGFLNRPGTQSVSILASLKSPNEPQQTVDDLIQWVWAIVLLQCPILSPSCKIAPQKRLVITARTLGLISSLPNRLHHRLVSFYSHPSCPTKLFAEKVELVNVFISDRIRHFLQLPDGFGAGLEPQSVHHLPKYMYDWSLLASSRMMALLCGSNLQSRKLPPTSFYNVSTDLIQPIDLVYDFECWESRKSSYTLCGYPCLLSMSSKISLLTYDGKRQMGLEARQAFIDSLLGRSLAPPVLPLSIRRSHLVEDSLRQIASSQSELKKLLKITFVDEEGVDGGGLKKEWFLLLIRQLVAPEYGMFLHDQDQHQIWFNPASQELEEFKLIGTVLGLAIYNRATLDFGLPLIGYRKLLGFSVNRLSDLATLKPEVAKSLRWLLEYDGDDFEEICSRNFVGDYDAYGTVVEVPLIPNGENIPVTKSNRAEFVKLYCDYILNKSIEKQFQAFSEGFNSIAAGNGLSLFQPEEIELLVIGSTYDSKLAIEDLKAITHYEGFQPTDLTIQYFWIVVENFGFEDQKKLLRFITGTDRIPATGISGLNLKITRSVRSSLDSNPTNNNRRRRHLSNQLRSMAFNERLPESHTCFNQLILSDFSSVQSLDQKLRLAINESQGFGLN
ncbi:uncharacterized protein PGTG_21133 [Puccinia graminis f. sp. tritici CRL 75-36-700-3]|uniref:HECT-type E3 ubiquitin transferase n=1 Tax=Puccinia graminis f. sp. tritici (strain CRL 75-36-700-3 / race SCCL) TaxID=418459 RepID=H6QQR4_PUCGT|nr:uncharacterized protein PGTG_21133 [Puccinia graminis f. sp. tritici CRL 75-36-700-3]EHS62812.1 hypothetical protein PGTG_21133 [Puccinia graminis f. sp. tritici CRL 75-36-700-3]